MMKLVGHPITWLFDRCTDQFDISRFLAKAEVDFWCIYTCMLEIKKHVRWDGIFEQHEFFFFNTLSPERFKSF